MSLVSTYVVMADGLYYQNPILFDSSGDWYICFDDDEPPEFVIRKAVISTSRKERKREISEKLKKLGITAKITSTRVCGQRNFAVASPKKKNEKEKMSFQEAISAFLELKERIPLDKVTVRADSIDMELKAMQCVIYDPKFSKGD